MKPVPNWGILSVNKKVDIPRLENGNLSKTGFLIKRKKVFLTNTCAIDSVIQLIAAAYAYNPSYRRSLPVITSGLFLIAKMMADG